MYVCVAGNGEMLVFVLPFFLHLSVNSDFMMMMTMSMVRGRFMRGRKLSRMKRGKVYCLQLPPDEPTHPACDNIDTKGNRQKASWFLFVVNILENMVLSLKSFAIFFYF